MRVFWRVEMWCRRQAAAAILLLLLAGWLTGKSSEALSTFGKSDSPAPKAIEPTTPPARPCSRQAECAGNPGASCVRTHYDSVTRCLCGDNLAPVNGKCEIQTKSLYHVCSNSDDCNDGLICGTPNITGLGPVYLKVHSAQERICLCDTENGYQEKEHTCSALYFKCSNNGGCHHGQFCGTPNINEPGPLYRKKHLAQKMICLCDTENGFQEINRTCIGESQ